MKKNGYHQLKIKSKIMISKSARIIGIIDQYGVLEDGEIYCTIFDPFSINPFRETIEGDVIVTRNPCLHPADIRKLKCVGFTQISDRFARLGRKEN